MPYRLWNIWTVLLGALGLVILAALVVLGADLYRARTQGPHWRRRLVAAAVTLLAAVGIVAGQPPRRPPQVMCYDMAPVRPPRIEPNDAATQPVTSPAERQLEVTPLTDLPHWKQFAETWIDASEIASGRRGLHPFDADQRKVILGRLDLAARNLETVAKANKLSAEEAAVLRSELKLLRQGVENKRTTEFRNATCYKPSLTLPPGDCLERVRQRADLLADLPKHELKPAVVAKIVEAVEGDLKTVREDANLARRVAGNPEDAKAVGAATDAVKKLRERLPATQPTSQPATRPKSAK